MKNILIVICCIVLVSCTEKKEIKPFSEVAVATVFTDSLSIRAIELLDGSLAFATTKGVFGSVDLNTERVITNVQKYDSIFPEFRAVAHTDTDFFMLSVANPALLYKTGDSGKMELVYKEEDAAVFYNAMKFWNNNEGIAIGDSMDGCLSLIITRDAGKSWKKLSCAQLPEGMEGEGAFAASNTNIAIVGDKTWIATTKGRIYFSGDKGVSWDVFTTPIAGLGDTHGIYSLDFYDAKLGFAIGGDYTKPNQNKKNKAITIDGGKSWRLVADGAEPDYKSCVQFVPMRSGNELVAVGFTGISYSNDTGESWTKLSDESFYTLRFLNDSTAYAAGKNRIAKLIFK
ncbi:oxidoreductase [Cellulophaga sp. F20128]|uniref:WD40/YVTN/BNR-like repeat-containing protein n=1 Tax=Cellulophaga sp. F20128 TaxID=2926413 RepID=UPI001FF21377|nr:oxidoreductase [Cellulophaga sp. F20128]MCK0156946.1 oxidoreductase [Cellulophaga sp. F20128]